MILLKKMNFLCNYYVQRIVNFISSFFLSTSLLFAQEKTISGVISDEEAVPLPGVNVIVKGN